MNEKDNWRINALKELKQVDAVEAFYEDEIKEMKEDIAYNRETVDSQFVYVCMYTSIYEHLF